MENLTECPVCKKSNFKNLLNCKDYVATGEQFFIVKCLECTHQFTNPRPEESEIYKYYQSDKYISHASSEKSELGVTYKLYDIIRNFSIAQKIKLIKKYHPSGKLLDLGCGLGYFLHGVKLDKHFEPLGADVSEEAIVYAKQHFDLEVINESILNDYQANSFDVITQWHVLEHVHKLESRMLELKKLLSKNGTMFIAVPNSSSFDAKYYGKFWDGYDVPRHLNHFNPKSFNLLMENTGFKVIKQKPMFFDAPYISMRSEYHLKNKLGFLKGGILGMFSNTTSLFTGNYSSILYIIKHK